MGSSTTTTTTTSTSTQNNQQLVVGTSTSQYNLGNYVTDVSLQPYISPRIISFQAVNMRPNCRMHIFFDGVLVDAYCAPGILAPDYASRDSSDPNIVSKTGNWGDAVVSTASGYVYGQFSVPAATFKTGDRTLTICDVSSIQQGNAAITTVSSAVFTASNLNVTKQSITLTTVNPQLSVANVVNTVITQNVVSSTVVTPDGVVLDVHLNPGYDPIAQTYRVRTPNGEAGMFMTSLDIYFKQKTQIGGHGVSVFMCETNNGYPDTTRILPFSSVHLDDSQINVSDDATVKTTFTFEAPVYHAADTLYAFIVKPDANDPDYLVYFAELGDLDITTGNQVYSQPTEGTAFYGASTTGWTALQSEYIKYSLKRADFTSRYGDAYFTNKDRDYIQLQNLSYANAKTSLLAGDKVFKSTDATFGTANAAVTGYVNHFNSNTGIVSIDTTTANWTGATMLQVHRFANTSSETPSSATMVAFANVTGIVDPQVNSVVPRFATVMPPGDNINLDFKGTANTNVVDGTAVKVNPDVETEFRDYERRVLSRTNEISTGSGKSATIHAQLLSDSNFTSPVIDLVKSNFLSIANKVDGNRLDLYDEMYNYGTALTKYVSPIVTLKEGMDAEDIQVRLTAYKPNSSYIRVFVKFLNGEDNESMTDKTWTPLVCPNDDNYSDPSNPQDFIEYTYIVPNRYPLFKMTGTATTTIGSNTITGSGTNWATDLKPGRYVGVSGGKSTMVTKVNSATSIQVANNATVAVTSGNIYLVPPSTTGYKAATGATKITGTVTTSTSSATITGTGTLFMTELSSNSIIGVFDGVNGDSQRIVSIANNTSLTVETAWSVNLASANGYNVSQPGVTYINKSGGMFTGYRRFQIKVVLLSDDSSKVPIIDDLQAIACQL